MSQGKDSVRTEVRNEQHQAADNAKAKPHDGVPPRNNSLVAVAAFSCLVVTLLQSLVIPAIPMLPAELGTDQTTMSWAVTATLLTGAIATPVIGRLGDLYSRRWLMIMTMGIVLVGSIIAPLGGVTTLILGRALQGVGTALVPVAMAEMRHSLHGHHLGGALALLSAMLGVGGGLGIPLGGVLLSAFGWESMFWFAAVLSAVSAVAILKIIPEDKGSHDGRFDVPGAILLAFGLTATLTAVSQGAAWGWGSGLVLGLFAAGFVFFGLWAVYELRQDSPLVNLRTTFDRPVLLVDIAALTFGLMMFTNLLLTTLELQNPVSEDGFGWSPTAAGLAMLPSAVLMFFVTPISSRLDRSFGPRAVLLVGAAVVTIGYILRIAWAPSGVWILVWATVISIGIGIGYAGLPMVIVEYAPAHETGSANAVNALMRSIGMSLSSAIVAAITAALAVSYSGRSVPSATALVVIAGIGIGLGLVTIVLSLQARHSDESIFNGLKTR